jgi:Ca2+-binding RTX toxin-like protein
MNGRKPLDDAALRGVVGGVEKTRVTDSDQEAKFNERVAESLADPTLADDVIFEGTGAGEAIVSGGQNIAILAGGGSDTIIGSAGNNIILGGEGNDVILAGAGADSVSGDAGNDAVIWSPGGGNDVLRGGDGYDGLALNLGSHVSLEDLLRFIVPTAGTPVLRDGHIDLTGVQGTIHLGTETITFGQFEMLVLLP